MYNSVLAALWVDGSYYDLEPGDSPQCPFDRERLSPTYLGDNIRMCFPLPQLGASWVLLNNLNSRGRSSPEAFETFHNVHYEVRPTFVEEQGVLSLRLSLPDDQDDQAAVMSDILSVSVVGDALHQFVDSRLGGVWPHFNSYAMITGNFSTLHGAPLPCYFKFLRFEL
jgi:hypothetical protein